MSLIERDQQVIWHPFTRQKNRPAPIPVVKASGSLLYAEDGSTYIDAISSWWVTLHGHGHPYIAEKIYQQALQLEQVIFAGFTHEPAVQLAERLLPILPGDFSRIFYSDNGSTSTEVALKMAIQYWWNQEQPKRNKIIAFRNAYHGDTFGAMSVSDRSVFTLAFQDMFFEVLFIDAPTESSLPETARLMEQHQDTIAACIYEPLVQGAGGMQMYEPEYLNRFLQLCKSYDILCIADEVMTGFGRTGKLFASEYAETKPDIICLSKGLTGGTMALGITACTNKIYQAYLQDDLRKTFFHGHSFTANPIACSAALASLDLLQLNNCLEKINWIHRQHLSLADRLQSIPYLKNVRIRGTILACEVQEGEDGYLNSVSSRVTASALSAGVYLRPLGNTVYLMPPYSFTEEEMDKVQEVAWNILSTLRNH